MKLVSFILILLVSFSSIVDAAHPNRKIIITDLLDDDIRALVNILIDPNTRSSVEAIVVSTGNVTLKASIANKIVAGLGLNIPVFAGTPTNLSLNPITAFAGNYEEEGRPLLTDKEIKSFKDKNTLAGDGAQQLSRIFKNAKKNRAKLDILLITAPIDLMHAINLDPATAKEVIADIFTMGLYKENASGKLISPYNTMAEPRSVIALLEAFQKGFFQRIIHVPSDTVQNRVGLPGGYFPENLRGDSLRFEISEAMKNNIVLAKILSAAQGYGIHWRHAATRQFGIGTGTDLDRWVPSSFQNPEKAAGFYLSDTIPAALAGMSEAQLSLLDIQARSVVGPIENANLNKPFHFNAIANGRSLHDLVSFDGFGALSSHINILVKASQFRPRSSFFVEKIALSIEEKFDIKNYDRNGKPAKALIVIFKNSPDDWLSLVKLVATESGRKALANGGIIAEGFETQEVRSNIIKVLGNLGLNNIPVAAGYEYSANEASGIPNFKGELALVHTRQSLKAFERLPMTNSNINLEHQFSTDEIFSRSAEWAAANAATFDAIVLGEGIDLVRSYNAHKNVFARLANLYLMGGGRRDESTGKLVLSRNWLPHQNEIMTGLEKIGLAGKKVFIFSSQDFGGALVSGVTAEIGNGKVVFNALEIAAKSNLSLRAINYHSQNWTRIFEWALNPNKTSDFNPRSPIKVVSISPLALSITEQWQLGDLEFGLGDFLREEISISKVIEEKVIEAKNSTGIFWIKPAGSLSIIDLADRLKLAIDSFVPAKKIENKQSLLTRLRNYKSDLISKRTMTCEKIFN